MLGRLTMIDVMTDPCKLRSVEGVVQEWISQEVGVVKLDSGGVALFHIGQVIIKDLGKMQVHRKQYLYQAATSQVSCV